VTIKGTLETFNLRELLQMLAFNQKEGTLVLETEKGPRTIHIEKGRVALVTGDPRASVGLGRVLRRRQLVPADRLERAEQIYQRSGQFLGDVLGDLGAVDREVWQDAYGEAIGETFFDLALTQITRFEFVEGKALNPDGRPGNPIEPRHVVEGLLLDLTRKMDTWGVIARTIPSSGEILEGTGITVDLTEQEDLDPSVADLVVGQIDGYKSLDRIVETGDVDRYTVLRVAAALLEGGGVRPVPTEDLLARADDLLARGEAFEALPLLRRAIERGDAPPQARVRLADAFEASGDVPAAAAELDTFAQLHEQADAPAVFEALQRALKLREGDPATAARLCDLYLRHRPWLKERRPEALEALKNLIHGSSTEGTPLDAAHRLAVFIQNGDAPSEDLLVLADLYAAGGEPQEAASALFRRAEDLLVAHRVGPARDLLRRVLEYDVSRADARRRLVELEGEDRRKKHHKRVVLLLVLLGLLVLGVAGAWYLYNQRAGKDLRTARETAEGSVRDAEEKVAGLVAAFRARVEKAETGEPDDEAISQAARQLDVDVRAALDAVKGPLGSYATELEQYSSSGPGETGKIILRGLDQRRQAALNRAQTAVDEVGRRAEQALAKGESEMAAGHFVESGRLLVLARNLAFRDPAVRGKAVTGLGHVDQYRRRFEESRKTFDAARARGDVTEAFRLGVVMLSQQLDSDLTRTLRLPVRLATTPPGAEVWFRGKPTDLRTPCVFEYSPFGPTDCRLRLPGRKAVAVTLPSFTHVERDLTAVLAWSPEIQAVLPEGPRWVLPAAEGPFAALWGSGGTPIVLGENGATVASVNAATGELGPATTSRLPNPIRMGGTDGGVEWRILGHRTLMVRTSTGGAWDRQALGRLERPPAVDAGIVGLVDETGTAYGYDVQTGEEKWRRSLGAPPSQALVACGLGFLVTTQNGSSFALDSATGASRALAAAAHGHALALPLGDGVLVVGGGTGGLRRVAVDGSVQVLGDATPRAGIAPWVGPDGVAWVEADGVRWFGLGATAAVRVTALGEKVKGLGGIGTSLYALDEAGTLRAVAVQEPGKALWAVPLGSLGGKPTSPPLPLEDAVFILVNGGLVAVER
jgi:hypothetical protein